MPATQVQCRFQTPSNEAVNTWNFSIATGMTPQEHADACVAALTLFYNATPAGKSGSVGSMMATWVARGVELRAYNVLLPKPRVPIIYNITMPAHVGAGALNVLPMDVACCLSYHGAPPTTRRTRGRVYLPGIDSQWMTPGSPTSAPAFNTAVGYPVDIVLAAANTLKSSTAGWVVWSRAGSVFTPVSGGWIDVEPDTQRRRGAEDSTRSFWGV